mgnify:CR=1 FL=1
MVEVCYLLYVLTRRGNHSPGCWIQTGSLDNRMRMNISLFDTDYDDLQVFQLLSNTLMSTNAKSSSFRFQISALSSSFSLAILTTLCWP